MSSLLIFGLGYSSQAVVRANGRRYQPIVATVRSPDRAQALTDAGVEGSRVTVLPFDGSAPSKTLSDAIAASSFILVSVPPGDTADPVLTACGDLLAQAKPQSLVYLSTVGVYGDHAGAWVDETTECRPVSARSHARLSAERAWQDWGARASVPTAILRLAGIYGPGQNAIEQVRAGTARRIIKEGQVFNRIHVDDIAAAVLAAFAKSFDGIVNVTDDEPSPPQDVIAYAAEILGVPPPPEVPFEAANLSAMGRSFYSEVKRVRNDRLKLKLGVNLSYPNFRDALQALAAGTRS
ncbi:MAG: NAD-dependent epimerase/dehydratase family protein [Alphaproteobacteria bacterium]